MGSFAPPQKNIQRAFAAVTGSGMIERLYPIPQRRFVQPSRDGAPQDTNLTIPAQPLPRDYKNRPEAVVAGSLQKTIHSVMGLRLGHAVKIKACFDGHLAPS